MILQLSVNFRILNQRVVGNDVRPVGKRVRMMRMVRVEEGAALMMRTKAFQRSYPLTYLGD
jgi:hypothetical protein